MNVTSKSWLLAIACSAAAPLHAEEWKHELAPYFMAAALDGESGIGAVTADVDASFSDLVEDLEFGFMGAYRASKDRYYLMLDAIYTALGGTGSGPGAFVQAEVDLDQIMIEGDVGYAVTESFAVYGGLRYNDLDMQLQTTGPLGGTSSREKNEEWVDPVVGAHYTWTLSDTWSATLRGDVGGFGVGSDFAWQGVGTLRWQTSPSIGVLIAYRYLDMDYENGSGADFFKYDMAMSGPAVGVVFTF